MRRSVVAGFIPGLLLATAFILGIFVMAHLTPKFIGGVNMQTDAVEPERISLVEILKLLGPVAFLVVLVLGGIYTGWFSPEEAGAAGSLGRLRWCHEASPDARWAVACLGGDGPDYDRYSLPDYLCFNV